MWFRDLEESDRALRTKITYRNAWRRLLEPAVGGLRLSDFRVSLVDRLIREIRQRRGSTSAHHAKVVLTGILGLAVRHDAIEANPVRELTPVRKQPPRPKVALTEEGLDRMRAFLAGSGGRAEVRPHRHRRSPVGLGLSHRRAARAGLAADRRRRRDDRDRGHGHPGAGGGADRPAAHEVPGEHAHDHPAEMADGVAARAARGFARAVGVPVDGRDVARPGQHPQAASPGPRELRVEGPAPACLPPSRRDPSGRRRALRAGRSRTTSGTSGCR